MDSRRDSSLEDDWEEDANFLPRDERVQRFYHFGVRFDYASSREVYKQRFLYLLLHPRHSRIYFLTFGLFWKALFSCKRRCIIEESSLLFLQSRFLSWGIYCLTGLRVPLWTYADFYDCFIHFRECYSISMYVWGGTIEDVRVILKQFNNYQNSMNSFLGGHQAISVSDVISFENVLASLGKLHPNFLLVGEGYDFEFLYENQKRLISNVSIYSPLMFRLMASDSSFDRRQSSFKFFLEGIVNFLRNPLRVLIWIRNLIYVLMVLGSKIFGSRGYR